MLCGRFKGLSSGPINTKEPLCKTSFSKRSDFFWLKLITQSNINSSNWSSSSWLWRLVILNFAVLFSDWYSLINLGKNVNPSDGVQPMLIYSLDISNKFLAILLKDWILFITFFDSSYKASASGVGSNLFWKRLKSK